MGLVKDYVKDSDITDNDYLLGSNGDSKGKTSNYYIRDLKTIFGINPSAEIGDITGLQEALDGKVDDPQVLTDVPAGAVFTDTVYVLPFTDNSVNWDASYAWGDHSGSYSLLGHQHTISDITDLDLSGKVDSNALITAGTNTKITYDEKGLVTSSAQATTVDIPDSLDRRYVTDDQLDAINQFEGSLAYREIPAEVPNGIITVFTTLNEAINDNFVWVYLNGVSRTDFTYSVSTKEVTMGFAPTTGSSIIIQYLSSVVLVDSNIEEAPVDGNQYARSNKDWIQILGGGGKFVDGIDPLDAVYLDGNVGIGKQPTALFDSDEVKTQKIIAGDIGANGFGIWNNANTRQDIFFYEDHNALWSTLGIGEPSPSQNERLWLGGSVNFGRISMAMQNSHARGFGSIFVRNDLSNEISLGIVGSNQSILGITEVSHITVKNNTPLVLATNNTVRVFVKGTGEVHINGTDPQAQLDVNGGIKIADDTDTITVDKVGTIRYRTDANNSYMDMAMQTGVATYQWVNIKTNTW